MVSYRIPNPLF